MERWGSNGLNFEVDVATAAAAAASAQAMNGLAPDARIMLLHLPTIEDVKKEVLFLLVPLAERRCSIKGKLNHFIERIVRQSRLRAQELNENCSHFHA